MHGRDCYTYGSLLSLFAGIFRRGVGNETTPVRCTFSRIHYLPFRFPASTIFPRRNKKINNFRPLKLSWGGFARLIPFEASACGLLSAATCIHPFTNIALSHAQRFQPRTIAERGAELLVTVLKIHRSGNVSPKNVSRGSCNLCRGEILRQRSRSA